ncbi:type II toxin-antitoxin system RelE/ParE family toxin [Immundisolibacter sp.]
MTRARFIEAARREFLAEVAYCSGQEPGLGRRFTAAVEKATARAVAFSLAGSPASRNTRRVFVKDFPFSVVYRPDESGIVIFAVAHHACRPEYWQVRVQER